MDLLNQKAVLLTICLLGNVALVADEDQLDESSPQSEQETNAVLEPKVSKDSDKNDSTPEPAQSKTQTSQPSELKPLVLNERIRSHANIDLPQDI